MYGSGSPDQHNGAVLAREGDLVVIGMNHRLGSLGWLYMPMVSSSSLIDVESDVTFDLTPEATRWLGEKGYDDSFGARPLARVIQENIKKPLADEILFGRLVRGGHVKVELKDGKIAFEIEPERGALERKADDAETV